VHARLAEAGQLRTAWRTLARLEQQDFERLVEQAFDTADDDEDKMLTLNDRKWLLATLAELPAEGRPAAR
jgi:hypothetical protein